MSTALEGGIGYWCWANDIQRMGNQNNWVYVGFTAASPDQDFPDQYISWETIRNGIVAILNGTVAIRKDLRAQVTTVFDPDNIDIDADAADCIVQAGLFSDVVYG